MQDKLPYTRDGADKERVKIENAGITALAKALEKQLRLALPNAAAIDSAEANLSLADEDIKDALFNMINEAVLLGQDVGRSQIDAIYGVEKQLDDIDWSGLAGAGIQWVTNHVRNLMVELNQTSRETLKKAIEQWKDTGAGFAGLIGTLEMMGWGFDKARAKLIAQTEVTNAFAKGEVMAWEQSEVVVGKEWRTANDELVCPICAPLGGIIFGAEGAEPATIADQLNRSEQAGLGDQFTHPGGRSSAGNFAGQTFDRPPAHPNCRCWLVPVVEFR